MYRARVYIETEPCAIDNINDIDNIDSIDNIDNIQCPVLPYTYLRYMVHTYALHLVHTHVHSVWVLARAPHPDDTNRTFGRVSRE
jgi:hypothetical protein